VPVTLLTHLDWGEELWLVEGYGDVPIKQFLKNRNSRLCLIWCLEQCSKFVAANSSTKPVLLHFSCSQVRNIMSVGVDNHVTHVQWFAFHCSRLNNVNLRKRKCG